MSQSPTESSQPVTWVVGGSGLLGGAVARELRRRRQPMVMAPVPWEDPTEAQRTLIAATERFIERARPWQIAWCAGAGVIGTSQQQLDQEIATQQAYVEELSLRLAAAPGRGPQVLGLASSAGGVFAGASGAPFTESTVPRPISPYGVAKIDSEELMARFAESTRTPLVILRIANLYGPGQSLTKPQGLISQLVRSHLLGVPSSIYVPLDTGRDYIFVDDAARLALDAMAKGRDERGVHLKIVASQRSTTIGAILGELHRITKHRPNVVLGSSPNARYQVRDLYFRSTRWTELDSGQQTTLPAGIHATLLDLQRQLGTGQLI